MQEYQNVQQMFKILRQRNFKVINRYPKYYTQQMIEQQENNFIKRKRKEFQNQDYRNKIIKEYNQLIKEKEQGLIKDKQIQKLIHQKQQIISQSPQKIISQYPLKKKFIKKGKKPEQNPDQNKYIYCQHCQDFISRSNRARHYKQFNHPKVIRVTKSVQQQCKYEGCNILITQKNVKRHYQLIHNNAQGPLKQKNKKIQLDQTLIQRMPFLSKVLFAILHFYFRYASAQFITYPTAMKLLNIFGLHSGIFKYNVHKYKQALYNLICYGFVTRNLGMIKLNVNQYNFYIQLTQDTSFYINICQNIHVHLGQFMKNDLQFYKRKDQKTVQYKINKNRRINLQNSIKRQINQKKRKYLKDRRAKRRIVLNRFRSLKLRIHRKPKEISLTQKFLARKIFTTKVQNIQEQREKRQQWMEYVAKYPHVQRYVSAAQQYKQRIKQKNQIQQLKKQIKRQNILQLQKFFYEWPVLTKLVLEMEENKLISLMQFCTEQMMK